MSILFTGRLVQMLNGVDATLREQYGAILVSRTLGYLAHLPSSPVADPYQYFRDLHLDSVVKQVQDLNEQVIIPVEVTVNYAREVWIARYRMVFQPTLEEVLCPSNLLLNKDTSVYAPAVVDLIANIETNRRVYADVSEAIAYYRALNEVRDGNQETPVDAPAITVG